MKYIVTYAGWTVYDGKNADKAWNAYIEAGPYGTWEEVEE